MKVHFELMKCINDQLTRTKHASQSAAEASFFLKHTYDHQAPAPPRPSGSGEDRLAQISTHTVQDMSPIDSYGYNPYDEQTYEQKEHAQHPDAALASQ